MSQTKCNPASNKNKALVFGAITVLSTLSVAGASSPVQAAILTWQLNDVVFEDGGTATGSFGFDADTNDYSDINITVEGPAFDGNSLNFTDDVVVLGDNEGLGLINLELPVPAVGFFWDTPLTNAGGTIDIAFGSYGTIFNLLSSDPVFLTSGSVTAQPIPEPLTLLATGVALGFGGLFKKKMSLNANK